MHNLLFLCRSTPWKLLSVFSLLWRSPQQSDLWSAQRKPGAIGVGRGSELQREIHNILGHRNSSRRYKRLLPGYLSLHATRRFHADLPPIVYDCIYEDLLPNEQQNFASANVMLGLTPTILSSIAPSVSEISLLSSRRPLMATLLSIGGPAVYVPRSLTYQSPLAILRPTSGLSRQTRKPMSKRRRWTWVALQYATVAAAVFKVVHTSWQLGLRTVIT